LLYYIIRAFVGWCLRAYFRNIVIVGRENLEREGPVIYASNHHNAALDPLLLATNQRPELYYLAAAEWFGKGFKNYMFRKHFNMIPIGRPWLKKGQEVSNEDVFEQCYKALAREKRIVIYPEGTSVTVSHIRELKTGTARMKIGGDDYLKKTHAKWREVKIIPVGLNYYHPRKFQSDVVMHLGDPIEFSDIEATDKKEKVNLMTERIREKMAELVFYFDEEGFRRIAKNVYLIYGGYLRARMNLSNDPARIYRLQKEIVDAVHFFHQHEPEKLEEFKTRAESLKKDLKKHKLDLRYMRGYRWPTILLIRLIFGLPLFAVGWVMNIMPLVLTKWIFEKYMRPKFSATYTAGKLNPSFLASMVFIIGMGVFLLWYLILSIVTATLTGLAWLLPIIILAGYGFGIYAARYARMFYDFVRMVLVINRRRRRPEAYQNIVNQRDALIREMDSLRAEYEKMMPIHHNAFGKGH